MKISNNVKMITVIAAVGVIGMALVYSATSSMRELAERPNTEGVDIVVYKTATCGCCSKWVEHLQKSGLDVAAVNVASTAPAREQAGVPNRLGSCHTAVVGDYWVEGHVPADLVDRLMTERPVDIQGIAVPGMPMGSPGMEGPNPVRYDVIAYHTDGSTSVYASVQGKELTD